MSSSYTQDVSNSSPSTEVERSDTSPSRGTRSRGRGRSGRGRARGKAALGRGRQVGRVRGDEVWLWNEEKLIPIPMVFLFSRPIVVSLIHWNVSIYFCLMNSTTSCWWKQTVMPFSKERKRIISSMESSY